MDSPDSQYQTRRPNQTIIDDDRQVATIICTDRHGRETGRTLIDLADLTAVRPHRWHCFDTVTAGSRHSNRRGRRYVATNCGGRRVALHRFILGDPPAAGMVPDHISGNGLDNRRGNLRWATPSQNNINRHTPTGPSGLVGVYWDKIKRRWTAEVYADGQRVHRSRHRDKTQAGRTRDRMAMLFQGEFARLNFGGRV